MILFDFRCPKCGHEEEALIKEGEIVYCSECGKESEKVLSALKEYVKIEDYANRKRGHLREHTPQVAPPVPGRRKKIKID